RTRWCPTCRWSPPRRCTPWSPAARSSCCLPAPAASCWPPTSPRCSPAGRPCCGGGMPDRRGRTLMVMQRIRAAVRRHPRWADGGLAVLLALVNSPALAAAGVGVVDWLWFGAAHLPLVWRGGARGGGVRGGAGGWWGGLLP